MPLKLEPLSGVVAWRSSGSVRARPWRPGDPVIRDNRRLLHGRADFDPSEPRI